MSSSALGDDRVLALPFYLVVDVSLSMSGAPLDALNRILPQVVDTIDQSPTLGDVVRIGVIDFSDDARLLFPLTDLRDLDVIPPLQARGATSYAAAFRLVKQTIESDIAQLKSDGYRAYRPAVFFLTDGLPTDDPVKLGSAFADLTAPDFKVRPNILPFGVSSQVSKEALDRWAFPQRGSSARPMRSYVYKGSGDVSEAIRQFTEILVSSVIASATSVSEVGSAGGFVLPADDDLDDWI